MDNKRAHKILSHLEKLSVIDYACLQFAKVHPDKITAQQWFDKFKNENLDMYPLNVENIRTYSECVDGVLTSNGQKFFLHVIVHQGENLSGWRERKLCEFYLCLDDVPEFIIPHMEANFRRHTENLLHKEAEEKYERQLNERMESLLRYGLA